MTTGRLTEFLVALKDLRLDALDELRDDEFGIFVDIGCEIFGLDAARLAVGEALHITRQASAEAA